MHATRNTLLACFEYDVGGRVMRSVRRLNTALC